MDYGPTAAVAAPQPLWARYIHGGHTVDFIPDAGTNYCGNGVGNGVPFGGVVILGGLAAIATVPLPAGVRGSLVIEGSFDFVKAASDGGMAAGSLAYWDNTNFVATGTASGNTYLGKVETAALTSDTSVRVQVEAIANASGSVGFGVLPVSAVNAAGTNYGTGGGLAAGVNVVSQADGTKVVSLPATPTAGTLVVIKNTTAYPLPVYPDGAATIDAVASHGAFIVPPLSTAILIAESATQWDSVCSGLMAVSAVAAAGSTVADAGKLYAGFNVVSAANGTKGVVLPTAPQPGTMVIVKSTVSNALPIYPDAAASINAIGSHGAFSTATVAPVILIATSATQWYTVPLVAS